MTIEIHKPELEALIIERLRSGAFKSIEDVLMQALQDSPIPPKKETRTGADLISAMQNSPGKDRPKLFHEEVAKQKTLESYRRGREGTQRNS